MKQVFPAKTVLTAFFLFVLAAMLWVTVTASYDRSVLVAAGEIWADPWGKATLFDAYFGFLTVFVWIYYRESGALRLSAWFIALMLLGNFAIAFYFLLSLYRLKPEDSWHKLFEPVSRG